MSEAFLMGQGGGGVKNPVKSISYTGAYANATYFTEAGCRTGFNENGDVFIAIQGGTHTSYENIMFSPLSLPTGITMLTLQTYTNAANPTGTYYACILTGVTQPININIDFASINSTYDWAIANVTVTLA